jgi:2-dehydropantoate 2-reductase
MAPSSYRIAVVGSGAIGSYYGAKLVAAGRDVHFLMRGNVGEIDRRGIRVRGKGGSLRVTTINHSKSTRDIGPCDLVLIAVKTTSNADLVKLLPPLLHQKTILLTLQNGLGNERFLAENFGAERVLGSLCFVCLNRLSPGVIDCYDPGYVGIGEYKGRPRRRTHRVASEFRRSGVICSVVENLILERWRKLVWNIPFNGLSVTAGGIDTEKILSNDRLRAETLALMNEVITAANKCGLPVPRGEASSQIKHTESIGAFKPSTLIDFEAGRPLEIEAIWGEPLRQAAAAGASTPRLRKLYSALKALDKKRRRDAVTIPTITVSNRQRAVSVNLEGLRDFAPNALRACLEIPGKKNGVLAKLSEVDVILVSDRRMAELHRRFLHQPGPTDVITFQHGEIFVSTETARKQARRFGNSVEQEMRLYIAHGLLHLHGFDDKNPRAAAEMKRTQEKLVAELDRALRRSMLKVAAKPR